MKLENLIGLGFTKNESIVYLSLIKFGKSSAGELIKDTKLHKKLVYENVEKLIDKGLVNYVIENNRKMFILSNPHMIVELFNEKLSEIEEKKKNAEKVAKEIGEISKIAKHKQEAVIYRGIKGIKTYYKEVLDYGEDYFVFGAPEDSVRIMKEHFWLNFVKKKNERKIKSELIFNQSLREYGKKINDKLTVVKFFDGDFEPLTETVIQGERVAVIVWTEEPILFLIQDKFVAESYKKFFDDMWKKAKK